MRRIIPALLLLSIMIAVFSVPRSQLHAAVLPPVSGDSHFGVVEAYEAPQLALNAGVRWQRIQFWWREFQPNGPSDWNPNALGPNGSIIKEAQAQGFDVAGLLINTPQWAAANGSDSSTSLPKNLYSSWDSKDNYWGQYVRQVVDRYRSVNYWIIWNEPDIRPDDANSLYFTFQGSEADYAQLLKVAYLNAKAVRPDVKIVTAGLTYWTDKQYNRRQYFDRLLETISKDPDAARNNFYFDVANVHLYVNPTQLYSVPNEFRSDMARYGLNKPVWVGETNVMPYDDPAVPGDHTRGDMRVTLDEQASFTIQAIAYALAAGVERFAFYKMCDTKGDVISGQALLRMDFTPRPEYNAYQVAALYFSNATKVTYQPSKDIAKVEKVVFERKAQRVTALWTFSPAQQVVKLPAYTTKATLVNKLGNKRLIEASNGVYTITLDRATANSDPKNPANYIVGGNPLLLVEDNPSETVLPTPAPSKPVQALSLANPDVDPRFAAYYKTHDGPRLLGAPLGPSVEQDGRFVQYFEKGRIEDYSKEATDPNWTMTYGLLALELSQAGSPISVGGEASTLLYTQLQDAIAREKRLPPPPNFTGGVMKMSDGSVFIPHHAGLEVRPGHRVLGTFWAYMNRKDLFPGGWLHDIGLPISGALEATVVKGNLGQRKITIQAFQRAILTYDPANPPGWQVERANIGTDYAAAFPDRVPLWSR